MGGEDGRQNDGLSAVHVQRPAGRIESRASPEARPLLPLPRPNVTPARWIPGRNAPRGIAAASARPGTAGPKGRRHLRRGTLGMLSGP